MKTYEHIYKYNELAWVLTLLGWMITMLGFPIFLLVAGLLAGIQEISKEKIVKGICLILFNILTLGIWGFVVLSKNKKEIKKFEKEPKRAKKYRFAKEASLLKWYKFGKILSIIAILIPLIGWFAVSICAGWIVGVQEMRRGRPWFGVMIILFNQLTLGLFSFIVATKRSKALKTKNLLLYEEPKVRQPRA